MLPVAEAAKQAVGNPASLNAVADAGYFNGEQVERCEADASCRMFRPIVPSTTKGTANCSTHCVRL